MVCISYVKRVKQITSLCHWITITHAVADCSDDRIQVRKYLIWGKLLQKKCLR